MRARSTVIGRIHRIMGTYKEKIAERREAARKVARKRRKSREARQRAIVATMLKRIAAGAPRDKAIARGAR